MATARPHLLERIFYILAVVFGAVGVLAYAVSYVHDDWSAHLPVLPFFLVVVASSCTLTAVTLSLVRLFHQDHRPDDDPDHEFDPPLGPRGRGSTAASPGIDGPARTPRS
ncbi:hypothetical protein [Kocuria tytonis]|uniref:Uncharacterized protein n=1 Tax=Kocuria tytonis TaxID=2054280 RepID=A0A495A0Z9_9MICC|nr:hypothetical protein [Kocuria tytonis]RKQ33139.1 hypothetical protein C1C97_012045 [Kocuria tytonis]